jgi:MFS family permease
MAVFGISLFFWQIVIPFLSDKFGRKTIMIPSTFIAIFLPLIIANYHSNFGLLLALIVIFTIGLGCQPLFYYVVPSESVNITLTATAISTVVLTGEIIGGTLGPVLAGVLADKYSLYAPLWLSSATAIIFFLLVFALNETAPVKMKNESNFPQAESIYFTNK